MFQRLFDNDWVNPTNNPIQLPYIVQYHFSIANFTKQMQAVLAQMVMKYSPGLGINISLQTNGRVLVDGGGVGH